MALAVSTEFKLGIGENVRRQDPPGSGPYTDLTTSLSTRGASVDFIEHWFHAGWKNAFPDSGVTYLAAYCNSGPEFNPLASYQNVLNQGKRLVLVWWWHNDQPCSLAARTDAQDTLRDCLVPLISALNNGEVDVILEPEYNRYDACNAYSDPSWATHLNAMITLIRAISKPGLTVKVGPGVGDWAYDRSAYQVEGSLGSAAAASDFIAFHEIYRQNADHPAPNDTNYGNASPDQIEHALSYARYLRKRFAKPVWWAYQSVNSANYTLTGQSDATLEAFRRRASLQAQDVAMFGPFWLFPDPGYPGESLIDAANAQRPAFITFRNEANAVIANTDRTHSIGFLSPDQGAVIDGMVSVQWISRGRPLTASSFNLEYSLNGGAFVSIASGLSGDDASVMSYSWDACAIAPAADVRLRLSCPATGATVTSGRFAVRKLSSTTNAQHTFESGAHGWTISAGGSTLSVNRVAGEAYFHGTGSLKVVCDFNANPNAYIETSSPGITLAGTPRLTTLIYVPFDLNPCTIPGAEVAKVKIDLQAGAYVQSPFYLLQEGWNRVVWDMSGVSGAVTYMKMNLYNKWGYTGNPAIYIDEIRVGNDLTYTGGACATPTPTPSRTASASSTPTPNGTFTATPTAAAASPTSTRTASPSPTPACAAEWNWDDGSLQGWGTSTAPAVPSMAASTALPHDGSHSLALSLDLAAGRPQALVYFAPSPDKDYTGQTLSYWLYIPAGMSNGANPSGATLYVKTGAGWVWHESAWLNLPTTAGWIQISLSMAAVANPNQVKEVGVKVALGGASPAWAGTVYVDTYGPPTACPSPTSTPLASTSTRTGTPTRSATPSSTVSSTASPTRTASPSPSASATASATRTATPSPSPSHTASPLASPTSTRTITGTSTATASPTPSATPSATRTSSPTSSASASPSASATASATRTATPSPSASATPTASPTGTMTRTATATSSATPSVTDVQSPTASPTYTNFAGSPTHTPTVTATSTVTGSSTGTTTRTSSPTPSPSASTTPTASPTGTMTRSATATSSATPSVTDVQSPTASPTHTSFAGSPTHTPTASPTGTMTATSTATGTASVSPSSSPTASASATPTPTPTPSPAAPASATPSATSTATPSSAGPAATPQPGEGSLLDCQPALQPQVGPALRLAFKVEGQVEGVEWALFTPGYTLMARGRVSGPFGPGWHQASALALGAPQGLLFARVQALRGGKPAGRPRLARLVVLR